MSCDGSEIAIMELEKECAYKLVHPIICSYSDRWSTAVGLAAQLEALVAVKRTSHIVSTVCTYETLYESRMVGGLNAMDVLYLMFFVSNSTLYSAIIVCCLQSYIIMYSSDNKT